MPATRRTSSTHRTQRPSRTTCPAGPTCGWTARLDRCRSPAPIYRRQPVRSASRCGCSGRGAGSRQPSDHGGRSELAELVAAIGSAAAGRQPPVVTVAAAAARASSTRRPARAAEAGHRRDRARRRAEPPGAPAAGPRPARRVLAARRGCAAQRPDHRARQRSPSRPRRPTARTSCRSTPSTCIGDLSAILDGLPHCGTVVTPAAAWNSPTHCCASSNRRRWRLLAAARGRLGCVRAPQRGVGRRRQRGTTARAPAVGTRRAERSRSPVTGRALAPRLAGAVTTRLLLRLPDRTDAALAGVPLAAVPRVMPPGRVLIAPEGLAAQLAHAGPEPTRAAAVAVVRRCAAHVGAPADGAAAAPAATDAGRDRAAASRRLAAVRDGGSPRPADRRAAVPRHAAARCRPGALRVAARPSTRCCTRPSAPDARSV